MTETLNRPAAPTEPALNEKGFPPLTLLDRCEDTATVMLAGGILGKGKCGAQAFVRAVFKTGFDLPFCGHHADEKEPALIAKGAFLIDERERINLKPTDAKDSRGF